MTKADCSGLSLNLTTLRDNRLLGIEQIDITGSGNNTLTLNRLEVLNISDESNTLVVKRDLGDVVNIGIGWTQGADGTIGSDNFNVYTQGAVRLKVQATSLPNQAPTDILMTGGSVAENSLLATVVGTFASIDPNAGDTFTYTFATGTGDSDNSNLTIVGDILQSNSAFDFETKSSYSIRVSTKDSGDLSFERIFTIFVTDVNEGAITTDLSITTGDLTMTDAVGTRALP